MPTERGDAVQRIVEMIYDRSSIRFSAGRRHNLENRLRERQAVCGLDNLEDYADRLADDREELDLLIDRISTKETYFFRIPGQFRGLGEMVLPRLEEEMLDRVYAAITRGEVGPIPLRIWSAGCATGQEPYSIAMTLLDRLTHRRAWKIELLATDLSREALAFARAGWFPEDALRDVSPDFRARFMERVDGGGSVSPALRKLVSFRRFNLRDLIEQGAGPQTLTGLDGARESADFASRFDIIFCRNVMIYFDFEAQQALVDNLLACLRPGGWLFTGDAELLHIYRHRFEIVEAFGTCWYRRPGGEI